KSAATWSTLASGVAAATTAEIISAASIHPPVEAAILRYRSRPMPDKWLTVMGSFVADLAFRTPQLPNWGQTIMGSEFRLGPGGKGSNQAVAAARLGARVSFISKLGRDAFGDLARDTYKKEGIDTRFLFDTGYATGAATIIVHETRGENAIVVVPGACFQMRH